MKVHLQFALSSLWFRIVYMLFIDMHPQDLKKMFAVSEREMVFPSGSAFSAWCQRINVLEFLHCHVLSELFFSVE